MSYGTYVLDTPYGERRRRADRGLPEAIGIFRAATVEEIVAGVAVGNTVAVGLYRQGGTTVYKVGEGDEF